MRAIARLVICLLFFSLMTDTCLAASQSASGFNETAARTGDVLTALSFVALAAIVAFVTFIVVIKNKRNKDSHE